MLGVLGGVPLRLCVGDTVVVALDTPPPPTDVAVLVTAAVFECDAPRDGAFVIDGVPANDRVGVRDTGGDRVAGRDLLTLRDRVGDGVIERVVF